MCWQLTWVFWALLLAMALLVTGWRVVDLVEEVRAGNVHMSRWGVSARGWEAGMVQGAIIVVGAGLAALAWGRLASLGKQS